ncbi:guanylate kinase [Cohnella pontilimi]|uniref:Guanylate kinase n=1 Tax=Cohnella pontilimi TaxID=2564100 RepID=A0A4U0FCQ3_9BACL|nr:guanylate kinase [Cohnella pontilimi]TJY41062.1 guanylate kinase [Cohnella pontilimi]
MLERNGREFLIVYTGPDGSGRKSVAEAVGHTFGMAKVISYVTRPARSGEVDDQDCHFISMEAYLQMELEGQFLESVEIDGDRYGIRRADVENSLRRYGVVYLILNREGAERMKELYGDKAIRLFVYADRRVVEERQRNQATDEAVIARRLRHYDREMAYRSSCEHAFENFDLGDTVFQITNTLETYLQRGLVDKD